MALADEQGLGAVTMRSVAAHLSATPAALYRHVANRSDLLSAIRDAVVDGAALCHGATCDDAVLCDDAVCNDAASAKDRSAVAAPGAVTDSGTGTRAATLARPRARLESLITELVELHRRHAWLAQIPPDAAQGEPTVAFVARVSAVLEPFDAPEPRRLAALAVLLDLVSGVARWGTAAAGESTGPGETSALVGIVADAVSGVLYPTTA
ncbi:TetR/AcrR family transcriptional regulator [Brevibacterium sp. 91QC2O2]|uniref:TetR/AcrR family transcriptional regulator n=1 Tax=Brevibacterium sp. 91QC2O2 TaxID=2968458 RepID=UPI00211D0AAE|nr:TetR/AcrR family transcriptional regulator [Brevibacterium sp. 91QC2O2]